MKNTIKSTKSQIYKETLSKITLLLQHQGLGWVKIANTLQLPRCYVSAVLVGSQELFCEDDDGTIYLTDYFKRNPWEVTK